jgi:hypothetical protein
MGHSAAKNAPDAASASRRTFSEASSARPGVIEAVGVLQMALESSPPFGEGILLQLCELLGSSARAVLRPMVQADDEIRWIWEITDLLIATMLGMLRFGLLSDPRGFDAINHYELRDWLGANGASEDTLNSALLRGCYDLAFAYENGDDARPALAAGQGIRGALRMFFTYRGSIFWKMRAGMGDVVFAPFYETLKQRNVRFEFFHRLENVKLAPASRPGSHERDYVEALEFDVQAEIQAGTAYQPLVDVHEVPGLDVRARFQARLCVSAALQEGATRGS